MHHAASNKGLTFEIVRWEVAFRSGDDAAVASWYRCLFAAAMYQIKWTCSHYFKVISTSLCRIPVANDVQTPYMIHPLPVLDGTPKYYLLLGGKSKDFHEYGGKSKIWRETRHW